MRLYSGSSTHFIRDTTRNQIAGKLSDAFFRHYRYRPAEGEVRSWQNSLRAVAQVFTEANLTDHGVILEYQLPLTSKRLDCLICGHDEAEEEQAVIVELKQWETCGPAVGEKLVTWVGGSNREVLHPSVQVGQYQQYLQDTHTAFYEGPNPIGLSSCAYLHNYHSVEGDVIMSEPFHAVLNQYPIFVADDVEPLESFLLHRLSEGNGLPVLKRIEESKYKPSKKLMQHVGEVIKGNPEYVLLDEQLVVYEKVFALARQGFHDRMKRALIVKGGPGTGKSVIAINLMSDLLLEGYNTHYATGSKAFTKTLRKVIGRRGAVQFKYFNSYQDAQENEIDVLICDEAHRIRKTSDSRWTRKVDRTDKPQVHELLEASKVTVFLLDDNQIVRPDEIGSVEYLRKHAQDQGCEIMEYELDAQFRCAGSEAYVSWIENTLGIRRTAHVLWDGSDGFDFQIYNSPGELDAAIREKTAESYSARMTAGFCWPWSKPKRDGTLEQDVVIGEYRRPWNAKSSAGKLSPEIPPEYLWSYDPRGIDQVGCIYTAQGFEFDYVGVIFGRDLCYDLDQQRWIGDKAQSHDTVVKRSQGKFIDLVKNTYRVLLTRGLNGCYVHFMDRDTERFFRSRMEMENVVAEGLDP